MLQYDYLINGTHVTTAMLPGWDLALDVAGQYRISQLNISVNNVYDGWETQDAPSLYSALLPRDARLVKEVTIQPLYMESGRVKRVYLSNSLGATFPLADFEKQGQAAVQPGTFTVDCVTDIGVFYGGVCNMYLGDTTLPISTPVPCNTPQSAHASTPTTTPCPTP